MPFLFVSVTSLQSMYYGATACKIRQYFKALRTAVRKEGGVIGFIEEIDAIAMRRGFVGVDSMTTVPVGAVQNRAISEGTGGVVNEPLVQMQSFDEPMGADELVNRARSAVNLFLPAHRQLRPRRPLRVPILLIAATNRGDSLDPALLRPGRFDRRMTFPEPDALGRRALVNALRRGARAMSFADLERARITEMVGIGRPVTYSAAEPALIATDEAVEGDRADDESRSNPGVRS